MDSKPYYIQVLNNRFEQKRRLNAQYSLRMFAKDLDIHFSSLSLILRGKRGIPKSRIAFITRELNLSSAEEMLFIKSHREGFGVKAPLYTQSEKELLDQKKHYRIIADWEYSALLELMDVQSFNWSEDYIAMKLGVEQVRAREVMRDLIDLELVDPKSHIKLAFNFKTTDGVQNEALKESHIQSLYKAKDVILSTDVEDRDFSSLTIALDKKGLEEYKKLIRNFRKQALALSNKQKKNDVYQLNIQFFSMINKD